MSTQILTKRLVMEAFKLYALDGEQFKSFIKDLVKHEPDVLGLPKNYELSNNDDFIINKVLDMFYELTDLY